MVPLRRQLPTWLKSAGQIWQSQRDCNHSAQRCEERATLGQCPKPIINPERVESKTGAQFYEIEFDEWNRWN